MFDSPTIEIRSDASELILCPSEKHMNQRQAARKLSVILTGSLSGAKGSCVSDVIVDLCNVNWISSAGLNALIRLRADAREHGVDIRLRSISDPVHEVFRLTRLERIFDLEGFGESEVDLVTAEEPVSV